MGVNNPANRESLSGIKKRMEFIEQERYKALTGIYKITNVESGRVYVGQTRYSFVERYWLHVWNLRHQSHANKYLQRAWEKYGESAFSFSVVEVITDFSAIDDAEIRHIGDCRNSECGCYNLADGGGGKCGVPMSERAKQIVGSKNRQHNLGKRASDQTRKKMTDIRQGVPLPKNRKNIDPALIANAKKLIMNGVSSIQAAKRCNIPYGVVNGLLCHHTWVDVVVDGWEEFLKNRSTYTRRKKEK